MSADRSVIEIPQHTIRNEDRVPAVVPLTPMAMLGSALSRGMDVDTIKGLMDLQQRWEKGEAEKAYNEAFAAFKAEAVTIIKSTKVTAGPLAGKSYAELDSVVEAVTPALSKHGLSASWKLTKDDPQWIEVTCTLKHIKGHSESVSMGGPPDDGGAKSKIQARASTVTYLERYTLKAACGVAEKGDDANGGKGGGMSADALDEWCKKIEATTDKASAKAVWSDAVKAAKAAGDVGASKILKETLVAHGEFIDGAGK
jgi:hypothetical protein